MWAAFNQLRVGLAVADAHGRVSLSNRSFSAIVMSGDGLCLRHAELHAVRPSDDARLRAAIAAVVERAQPEAAVSLARPSGRRPYALAVRPLSDDDPAHVLLVMSDPAQPAAVAPHLAAALYGLTQAESAVAARIAAGETLEYMARELGISMSTCRTHLEKVFRKTGVQRQAALVRELLTSAVGSLTAPSGTNP